MTTKELIRREIERRIEGLNTATTDFSEGRRAEIRSLYDFLASLPDEPEQPTRGYDEDYLNEKIAKASKSWEGVDVDKFMDEVRGREPVTDCHELKKHTKEWVELMVGASFPEQDGDFISEEDYRSVIKKTALHFAEWQKRKMMEGAVEGKVENGCFGIVYLRKNLMNEGYSTGDKIRIVVCKKDD